MNAGLGAGGPGMWSCVYMPALGSMSAWVPVIECVDGGGAVYCRVSLRVGECKHEDVCGVLWGLRVLYVDMGGLHCRWELIIFLFFKFYPPPNTFISLYIVAKDPCLVA